MSSGDRARTLGRMAWGFLEYAETLQEDPHDTIVPSSRVSEATAQGALAILDRLRTDGGHQARHRLDVQEVLGQGGMGVVRLARQVALGRNVAVKTLRQDKRSPARTAELLQEAWVTGSLEHPNVVPVHDLGIDEDGSPVLVFKRIDGVTWSKLLNDADEVRGRFGASDLLAWNLSILMQVLNAVRFAHSRGIVHRDLKPDNVMIGEFGEVYVLDWGIAVSMVNDGTGRLPLAANVTEMAGTPCYMAPEMLGGAEPGITERTDIYLLGATLYEVLTGRPPHNGEKPLELLTSVVESQPAFPPDAPEGLVSICRQAMDPDPERRFASAADMHRAIHGFLQHRGSSRLVQQAEARFAEMQHILARHADQTQATELRQQLYKLYGACRFGFLEALTAWSDNASARNGLHAATRAMIEYELAQGEPRAAAGLMADVAHVIELPADLRERVNQALRSKAEEEARLARLERLGRDLDLRVGSRTRVYVVLAMGLLWTLGPFIGGLISTIDTNHPSNLRMAMWSSALIPFFLLAVFVARKSLLQSAVNRRLVIIVGSMMAGQVLLHLGAASAGFVPATTQIFQLFMWGCVATSIAIAIDARLLPSGLAYLLAFFAAGLVPDQRTLVMAVANLGMLFNVVIIWGPGSKSAGRD